MNNTKYIYYLVFMGLFCTLNHHVIATQSSQQTSQEITTTNNTTPEKKQDLAEIEITTASQEAIDDEINKPKQPTCPHTDIPLENLNETELEEILACKQEQQTSLNKDVEKIEQVLHKKSSKKLKQKKGCPYSNIPLKKLKAHELEEVYAYTQNNKKDAAFMIDLLERLIALSDNHANVKQYKLQLADTHYNAHHIEKAAAYYEDFVVLYPASQEAEYVHYKAIVCMFELSLEPDRDQTNTKKTIALIKEFLKRAKNQDLIQEAQSMMQTCYNRLYDHEVYVFNFYLKRKNFVAAQMRLDYIAKTFTQTIAQLTEKVEDLVKQLENAKNPASNSFFSSSIPSNSLKDEGPVDTTKNRATKFLA